MAGERTLKSMASYRKRYQKADRSGRSRLLDEFCSMTDYHRKYAITLLCRVIDGSPPGVHRRRRGVVYGPSVAHALESIWERAGYPWSVRLHALLPQWLPFARTHVHGLTPAVESALLKISPRQIDRLLSEKKRREKRNLYGRTKPGSLLKHQIEIRTDNSDISGPGYVEVDLVSHSGPSASGEFVYSFNITDIYTGWTETRAVLGKGEAGIVTALAEMRLELPFPLLGIDSDNGSEFINHHLVRWCQTHQVKFTRSRPYKKNDNAHIEQKNWTHVRKIFGWDRYDTPEACAAINVLYRGALTQMQNYFQPNVKLVSKERVGSKIRRRYSPAQTPLERLVSYYGEAGVPLGVKRVLSHRSRLDPFALSEQIEAAIARLTRHQFGAAQKTGKLVC